MRNRLGLSGVLLIPVCLVLLWTARQGSAQQGQVFEAEQATGVEGTWERRLESTASGGAVLETGEGTGRNIGNTFGKPRNPLLGSAVYEIEVPSAGSYTLWGRCWSTDQCGNSCWVGFDERQPVYFPEGRKGADAYIWNESQYRRWLWLKVPPVRLSAGWHRLRVHVREDGFRIDQWALLPVGAPAPVGRLLATVRPRGPPSLRLHVDPQTRVIDVEKEQAVSVWLRKRAGQPFAGRLEVSVPEGATASPRRVDLDLKADEVLRRISVTLSHAADFPRGEHEYTFALVPASGGRIESTLRLSRPFLWEVLGPLPLDGRDAARPVPDVLPPERWPAADRTARGLHGTIGWRRTGAVAAWFTPYGFLDFEQALGETENAKAYARTTVHAPRAGRYLLEVLTDDEASLWVNGRHVFDNANRAPATDHFGHVTVALNKGANTLALAVRQHGRYWQMRVRIRGPDGRLSNVR